MQVQKIEIVDIEFYSSYDELLYTIKEENTTAKEVARLIMESEIAFDYAVIVSSSGREFVMGEYRCDDEMI